jgi:hypothetical protein
LQAVAIAEKLVKRSYKELDLFRVAGLVRVDACLAGVVINFERGAKGRYFAYGLSLNYTVIAEIIALCGDLVVRLSDSETWWA